MEQILTLREPLNKVQSGEDLFKKIKKIKIDYNQENLIVFYLNVKCQVKKYEVLFKGGVDACLIDPKTLFRKALLYNTPKIIISHNHPSNNLNPSYEDKELFRKLKDYGNLIDIQVLDSIVFNKTQFHSINS